MYDIEYGWRRVERLRRQPKVSLPWRDIVGIVVALPILWAWVTTMFLLG